VRVAPFAVALRWASARRDLAPTTSAFLQAVAALAKVKSEAYRSSFNFLSWQARCFIMTRKPEAAWKLYLHLESKQTEDVSGLLHIIANECYGMGQFLYSCKAFQVRAHM
jgi:intraflagellar transport protein 56